jgi:hypothetical protein
MAQKKVEKWLPPAERARAQADESARLEKVFNMAAECIKQYQPQGPDEIAACRALAEAIVNRDRKAMTEARSRLAAMQEMRPKLEAAHEQARQEQRRQILAEIDREIAEEKAKAERELDLKIAAAEFKATKERERTWARELLDTLKGFRTRAGRPTPAKPSTLTSAQLSGLEALPEGYIRSKDLPAMPLEADQPATPKGRRR